MVLVAGFFLLYHILLSPFCTISPGTTNLVNPLTFPGDYLVSGIPIFFKISPKGQNLVNPY